MKNESEKIQYTKKSVDSMDREALSSLVLSMQSEINELQMDVDHYREQNKSLLERLYGRKTEKTVEEDEDVQLQMDILNEAEAIVDEEKAAEEKENAEPEKETVTYVRRKTGFREEQLAGLPTEVIEHTLNEEQLKQAFPDEEYTLLPCTKYKKVVSCPRSVTVEEHHLYVYKGKKSGKIVKAEHPTDPIPGSIATSSLISTIMTAKFQSSMPLNRINEEYKTVGIDIGRQNMAHWMIRCAEQYLSLITEEMKNRMLKEHYLCADETPCLVAKDGRKAGSKSYMWVYRTSPHLKTPPIILYDYEKTRNSANPLTFLNGYEGYLECDGFDAYPVLERESNGKIQITNCMVHARREFEDIIKSADKADTRHSTKTALSNARTAVDKFRKIYEIEGRLKDLTAEERKEHRCKEEKPLVEAYFAWIKEKASTALPKSKIGNAFNYSILREKYLTRFLEDGNIPIDNNSSERDIRSFTLLRKNAAVIDTVSGAEASATIISVVKTAAANGLNVYEYLNHILTEIPKHMDEKDKEFLTDLLPWSKKLPSCCYQSDNKNKRTAESQESDKQA